MTPTTHPLAPTPAEQQVCVSDAMAGYLRRCRTGGMPREVSDSIATAVHEAQVLGYFGLQRPPVPVHLSRADSTPAAFELVPEMQAENLLVAKLRVGENTLASPVLAATLKDAADALLAQAAEIAQLQLILDNNAEQAARAGGPDQLREILQTLGLDPDEPRTTKEVLAHLFANYMARPTAASGAPAVSK